MVHWIRVVSKILKNTMLSLQKYQVYLFPLLLSFLFLGISCISMLGDDLEDYRECLSQYHQAMLMEDHFLELQLLCRLPYTL